MVLLRKFEDHITARFHSLLLAASITLYVILVSGGIVRVTNSGGSCPDWPTCFGQWAPPAGQNALIDYLHRLVTFLAVPLVSAAFVIAWKRFREEPRIFHPLAAAFGALVAQVLLGAVLPGGVSFLPREALSALHLGLSLLLLGILLVAAVVSFYARSGGSARLDYRSPFARLSLLVLAAVFLLLLSGAVVAGTGSSQACPSWPLCSGGLPDTPQGWINLAHRFVVLGAGALVTYQFLQAWRTQRSQTPVLVATTAAFVLFIAQALLGAKLAAGFPAEMIVLHEATAVAVWAAVVIQAVTAGFAARTAAQEQEEAAAFAQRSGMARDLLALTKPVVVLLLLVTTYAGMVIGAQAFPSAWVTFWTLLGGFMAAGGSGAINQYIDREDDTKMQRTQKRPIPAGRLTPGEGLAFGVGIALASFYLMVAFTNLLAALLTLAGIIYYVLLYSIFLKKTTVQNIVIGGGAGAIPPLVGWAAATGSLNIPSLFLFAVVFMWTPPHFWALALVRRKDYARAGVPMLPVIRGENETRWQIFLYTAELVGLTLLLPVFGLGGSIYLVGAAVLGGWLLYAAWKVWKEGGNKLAWKMYRYSSMYLAFLFVTLMIDRLL
jgi:protoheme IX farnesyltransferase